MAATGIPQLRTVADYQFGAGAGEALFPPGEEPTVRRSTTGRPQQVLAESGRIVSYGVDGRFTLGIEGGRRLEQAFAAPQCRVALGVESVPFVSEGRNAFSKFVRTVDPAIRPGDEVLVVLDADVNTGADVDVGAADPAAPLAVDPGDLLAVGRAELSAAAMTDFETGMAVKVRQGID